MDVLSNPYSEIDPVITVVMYATVILVASIVLSVPMQCRIIKGAWSVWTFSGYMKPGGKNIDKFEKSIRS